MYEAEVVGRVDVVGFVGFFVDRDGLRHVVVRGVFEEHLGEADFGGDVALFGG